MAATEILCLVQARRIGVLVLPLMSLISSAAWADTEAVCRTVAERYTALAATTPNSDPLALFKKAHDPRVTVADPVKLLASSEDFDSWARTQKPPVELPKDLTVDFEVMAVPQLHRLPGTSFYALHSIDGTAQCYDSRYFFVRSGHVIQMREPSGMQNDNPEFNCGVERTFGTVDQTPVYFQSNTTVYDQAKKRPDEMATILRVLPWQSGQLGEACEVRLEHTAKLPARLTNYDTPSCKAANCDAFKQAALSIVQYVRSNPDTALDHYLGLVTAEQRSAFERARKASDEARAAQENGMLGASTEPESTHFIDVAPLRLPYVLQGTTYVVSAGRITIGWRTFLDWRVTFETLANGKLVKQAEVPIGVEKGPLASATVSTVKARTQAGR